MPTALLKRVNWDLIYPPFRDQCFELAARCQARGVDYFAICGHRPAKEQARLYFQGRLTRGPVVTYAKPWASAHQYGLAVDWCKDADVQRAGLQPDWDLEDYEVLAEEATKLGLDPGLRWKRFREGPHVGWKVDSPLLKFKPVAEKGGLPAVWAHLDSLRSGT